MSGVSSGPVESCWLVESVVSVRMRVAVAYSREIASRNMLSAVFRRVVVRWAIWVVLYLREK